MDPAVNWPFKAHESVESARRAAIEAARNTKHWPNGPGEWHVIETGGGIYMLSNRELDRYDPQGRVRVLYTAISEEADS